MNKNEMMNATKVVLEKRISGDDTWYKHGAWAIENVSLAANAAFELGKMGGCYEEVRLRFE